MTLNIKSTGAVNSWYIGKGYMLLKGVTIKVVNKEIANRKKTCKLKVFKDLRNKFDKLLKGKIGITIKD